MLPFYVGVEEPADPEPEIRNPAPNPPTLAEWPEAMLAIINAARDKADAKPLGRSSKLDAAISDVSRSAAEDPDAGPSQKLQQQLARQGLSAAHLDIHAGSAEFVDETTRRLLLSPRVRSTFLDPERTLAGLTFDRLGTETRYGLLLYTPPPVLSLDTAATRYFKALNEIRLARRKLPILEDAELRAGAIAVAERVCKGELDAQTLDIGQHIKLRRQFDDAQARSFVGVYMEPADADDALGAFLDQPWTHGAAASCRGRIGEFPDGQFVMYLLLR